MNKREARRFICRVTAESIEGDVASGAEYLYRDEDGNDLSEQDVERIKEAALELAHRLRLRGIEPLGRKK